MEATYTRPKLKASANFKMKFIVRTIFTLVIIAAVPLALLLLYRNEAGVRFHGVVDTGSENVSPVEASRIVSIEVEPGQQVKAGDVLVRFDSAQRLLDESMNDIKISELEQRLVNRRDELIETERRCRDLVRKAEVTLEEALMDQIRDEADLEGYEAELRLIDPLIKKKLVSETDIIKIRPKAVSLRRVVGNYKKLIATLKQTLAGAKDDLAEASRRRAQGEAEIDKALESIMDAKNRSDSIRKADPAVLRALSGGTVSRIFHRPGDIVVDGEPVLRLTSGDGATYINGYLTDGMQDSVRPGDKVYVTRRVIVSGVTAASVEAVVDSVDSEVMDLFDDSGKMSNTTVRGRKVRIRIVGDASSFVPGESVTITDKPIDGVSSIFQ